MNQRTLGRRFSASPAPLSCVEVHAERSPNPINPFALFNLPGQILLVIAGEQVYLADFVEVKANRVVTNFLVAHVFHMSVQFNVNRYPGFSGYFISRLFVVFMIITREYKGRKRNGKNHYRKTLSPG